jgi:hypothetical protein
MNKNDKDMNDDDDHNNKNVKDDVSEDDANEDDANEAEEIKLDDDMFMRFNSEDIDDRKIAYQAIMDSTNDLSLVYNEEDGSGNLEFGNAAHTYMIQINMFGLYDDHLDYMRAHYASDNVETLRGYVRDYFVKIGRPFHK